MLKILKNIKNEKSKLRKVTKITGGIKKLTNFHNHIITFNNIFKEDKENMLNYLKENKFLTDFICDDTNMNTRYYDLRTKLQFINDTLLKVEILQEDILKNINSFTSEVDELNLEKHNVKLIEYTAYVKDMFTNFSNDLEQEEGSWSTVNLVETLSRTKVIGTEVKELANSGLANEHEQKKSIGVNVL